MAAGKYVVNWSDPAFPRIERVAHGGVRYADAKREVYQTLYGRIDQAREVIAYTRGRHVSDVEDSEDYDRYDSWGTDD